MIRKVIVCLLNARLDGSETEYETQFLTGLRQEKFPEANACYRRRVVKMLQKEEGRTLIEEEKEEEEGSLRFISMEGESRGGRNKQPST